MKGKTKIFLCFVLVFVCGGCAQNEVNQNTIDEPPAIITQGNPSAADIRTTPQPTAAAGNVTSAPAPTLSVNTDAAMPTPVPVPVPDPEPDWAKAIQRGGKLYQGLNLDGIGDSDDEVYVSIFKFDTELMLVLRIHFGTGENASKVFPVGSFMLSYSVQFGKLFSEDKDAIIVESVDNGAVIDDPAFVYAIWSDNGAADVFLDTSKEPITLGSGETISGSFFNGILKGTRIVNIEGLPRKGLKLYAIDYTDRTRRRYMILYWVEEEMQRGWTIIEEGVISEEEYFDSWKD